MPEPIPEEAVQAARDAVKSGIAQVYHSGGVERIEFVSAAFVAWLEEIRADERRKVAEEIAAEIERVVVSGNLPRPKVERGAFLNDGRWAARIARQIGEARDSR